MAEALEFDWDEANIHHIARHRITPAEIEQVFANGTLDVQYESINGEERWSSIGHTDRLRVTLVVWTVRGQAIRAITAREASKSSSYEYLKQRGF